MPAGTQGQQVYIAFVLVNNQTASTPTVDTWFIDNVSMQTLVPCDDVLATSFTATGITPVSATLNWTHPTATQFEIQVLPTPQTPGPVGTATDNSFDASSLTPGTVYNVYIKALCSSSSSAWAGPFTFSTLKMGTSCAYPIVIPDDGGIYTLADNLETYQNPAVIYTTQGSNCFPPSITLNQLNGSKVFFNYTPTEDGLITVSNVTNLGGFNHRTSVLIYDSCADVGVSCLDAAMTTAANVPGTISNFFVEAGNTYVIVLSSQLAANAGIAFTFTLNSSNCPAPFAFTYSNLLTNSVEFSWDNVQNLVSAWEYTAQPAGAGAPTGAGTPTTSNTGNIINTGLTPDTPYDLYVRSVCGGTPGPWSAPYRFRTQCTVFEAPYEQTFTGATNAAPAACWSNINANADNFTWAYLSSTATVFLSDAQKNWNDYLVSPAVNITGAEKRLRFKYRISGSATNSMKFEVLASNTGIGVSNFSTVLIPDTQYTITGSNYIELIVNLPAALTGPVNFAWHIQPNPDENASRIYIDDVYVENIPLCPNPTTLTVVDVTEDTAEFSWTAGNTETQWEVIIQEENLATPLPTQSGTLITSNPYTATELDHSTKYEIFIRANCNEFGTSEWIGPVPFRTDCSVMDLPFIESFNDTDPETVKFCWTTNNVNGDSAQFSMNATNGIISATPLANPPASYDDWLISPPVQISGHGKLLFDYRAQSNFLNPNARFGVEVLISTTDNNPASFSVLIPLFEVTNTAYLEKSIYFDATGPVYIAFRVPPQFEVVPALTSLNIDNVRIEDAPACPAPSGLAISNFTLNSVDVTWVGGNEETQWQVAVQPIGSGNPNANPQTVNSTTYQVTDLVPGTEYEVFVRALCDDSNSQWIGPKYFSTLCNTFTSPFTETFNDGSPSEACWKIVNGNNDSETWNMDSGINAYEGNHAAAMFTGTNGNNNDWLISPKITVTANQRLRYYYRVYEPGYIEDLEVALSTTGNNPADFTTILYDSDSDPVIINNIVYKEKIINLPAGVTGDIHIAFHVPFYPSTGIYRGQMIMIDNVNIEDVPACPEPFNVVINPNTVGDTQFNVQWETAGTQTAWEIAVVPYDVEITGDIPAEYIYNATTNPFTVTNVDPSSKYNVYVRTICAQDSQSAWTLPVEVVTKCDFNNLCEYTVVLTSDTDIEAGISIYQNSMLAQYLPFTGDDDVSTPIFLCNGSEFEIFFDTMGFNAAQYSNYQVTILNAAGETVWQSAMGVGTPKTIVHTGVVQCGPVTCPQPTALTANEDGQFSWTAGGTETQWEVAVQPLDNQTLPQSGTIVSTPSYTPVAADFNDPKAATYEYFVRAVCAEGETSYWSGPYDFVRNNGVNNALELPVNNTLECEDNIVKVSFRNATLSSEALTCPGTNQSDVWFSFTATSRVHIIKAIGFEDYIYGTENNFTTLSNSFGLEKYPDFTMTLYEVNTDGSLDEVTCVNNNALVASYASELTVGTSYKVRLTLNAPAVNTRLFNVCLSTPQELCNLNAVNYDFEEPALPQYSGAWESNVAHTVVPGWRTNIPTNDNIWIWETLNAFGFQAYSQNQCIQLSYGEGPVPYDPNDMVNIQGIFKDMDSSEATEFFYSFAHLGRFSSDIDLYAGPPQGPFTLVESVDSTGSWNFVTGTYEVPEGQSVTRFIFRARDYSNGNVIDAANFVPNNMINATSATVDLDCDNATYSVTAEGVGTWIPAEDNPGPVVISDPASRDITITGFMNPGTYVFTWKTRYCEDQITLQYDGVAEVPAVDATVNYCVGDTADALSAPELQDYTLVWYDAPVGGTALPQAPTPSTATEGTTSYYAAYANAEGCEGGRAQIDVIVTPVIVPEVVFSYDAATYCTGGSNPVITLDPDFTTGGVFTISPATGITIDASTGAIDLAGSTAGTYNVTYTVAATGCNPEGVHTLTLEVEETIDPVTDFTYNETYCIAGVNPVPTPATGFYAGGEYSAPVGVAINPATGEIDLANTASGTYTITYTVTAQGCILGGSSEATITVAPLAPVVTSFSYENPACLNFGEELVPELAEGFTFGGTFSSATLTVDATTGVIDLTTALEGNHEVTYTLPEDTANCIAGGTFTANVELTTGITPVTEFSYDAVYCYGSGSILPVLAPGFTSGGAFTSSQGLVINPVTGEIDAVNSTAGTYEIVYTIGVDEQTCNLGGTYSFTTSIAGDLSVVIEGDCRGADLWLAAVSATGSFDDGSVVYNWKNNDGVTVSTSADFNVAQYITEAGLEVPQRFTVTVASGDCSSEAEYIVTNIMCEIPKGISPNGDGLNDNLNLTGLGVTEISIFNRYGRKIYNYSGGYTNQWRGQDDKNSDLPDGTYFYSLKTADGTSKTGWVYINRQY